jgi:type III secretory pathway component EscT
MKLFVVHLKVIVLRLVSVRVAVQVVVLLPNVVQLILPTQIHNGILVVITILIKKQLVKIAQIHFYLRDGEFGTAIKERLIGLISGMMKRLIARGVVDILDLVKI